MYYSIKKALSITLAFSLLICSTLNLHSADSFNKLSPPPVNLDETLFDTDDLYREELEERYLFSQRYYLLNKSNQLIDILQNKIEGKHLSIFIVFYISYYLKTFVNEKYHSKFFDYFKIAGADNVLFIELLKIDSLEDIITRICWEFNAENEAEKLKRIILKEKEGLLDLLYLSKDAQRERKNKAIQIAKQEYELLNGEAEIRRRELLKTHLSSISGNRVFPIIKPDLAGFALTYQCSGGCAHCQIVDMRSKNNHLKKEEKCKKWRKHIETLNKLDINQLVLTGGEVLKYAKDEVLYIIENSDDLELVQIGTNSFFADTVGSANNELKDIMDAVSRRSKSAKKLQLQLCISFDWFHQRVYSKNDGRLYEKNPLKNVVNLIQAVLENWPEINILLASNYNPNQDLLIRFLQNELLKRNYYFDIVTPRYVSLKFGSDLPDDKALREGGLCFYKKTDDRVSPIKINSSIFIDYINAIGWAETLDYFEFSHLDGITKASLSGQYKVERLFYASKLIGIDSDGNANYMSGLFIRNWSLGNAESESINKILGRIAVDPLFNPYDNLFEDIIRIASEVLDRDIMSSLYNAPSPSIVIYRLLRSPAMRLYITKRLFQIKYSYYIANLELLDLDCEIAKLKEEYIELMRQEPDRNVMYTSMNISVSVDKRVDKMLSGFRAVSSAD